MNRTEMLKTLRRDLRGLGKYETLNKSYAYTAESGQERGLCFKGNKGCIMAMQIVDRSNGLVCRSGGLWDATQKAIVADVDDFTKGVN